MPTRLILCFTLLLAMAQLPAQSFLRWSPDAVTELPGAGNTRLAAYHLSPPKNGVERVLITARVRLNGGKAYLYVYGSTPRNEFLGYRESERIEGGDGTSVTLSLEGLATADMDSVTVGLAFYGAGSAVLQPPTIEVEPVPEYALNAYTTKYLREFFGYVRDNALDRDSMDWPLLTRDAWALAARADSMPDLYEVLNFTLRRIDKHSFLSAPRVHRGWGNGNNDTGAVDPNLKYPTGRRVEKRMAYLRVPGVSSGHPKTLSAYADSLRNLIARLDGPDVDEWVVDLRSNTGGNCWPMLSGIGPLLGEGVCGYFMQRDGTGAKAWSYRNGGSYLNDDLLHQVKEPYQLHRPARVAVLYGPETSSSAEVVAIAFRGRPGTRSFGRPTGGYSTGNRTYRLSDGAAVLLTVSVYGDRHKRAYGAEVIPEVIVSPTRGVDAASEAAAAWLRAGR